MGGVIGAEARRKGVDVILGPVVNLQRSPDGGRHFEAFSEDPQLTAAIGAAIVRGMQALSNGRYCGLPAPPSSTLIPADRRRRQFGFPAGSWSTGTSRPRPGCWNPSPTRSISARPSITCRGRSRLRCRNPPVVCPGLHLRLCAQACTSAPAPRLCLQALSPGFACRPCLLPYDRHRSWSRCSSSATCSEVRDSASLRSAPSFLASFASRAYSVGRLR